MFLGVNIELCNRTEITISTLEAVQLRVVIIESLYPPRFKQNQSQGIKIYTLPYIKKEDLNFVALHLNTLEFHLPKDTLCQIWLKLAWHVNLKTKCGKFTIMMKLTAKTTDWLRLAELVTNKSSYDYTKTLVQKKIFNGYH